MSIKVGWGNSEQTVVWVEIRGSYTWEEFDQAGDQITTLIQSVPHAVALVKSLDPDALPPSGNAMSHIQRVLDQLPGNLSRVIMIGISNAFARTMMRLALRIHPTRVPIHLVRTREDAWALLRSAG